ncbi:MAG TPA: GNAT family N-acetyltransferase [Actinomycetes bacterium]|jgi:GNAT superfamily N-acetyltransferase|nr:GNAT family N-acetyltransferase [Actinomycetes bacterium]
MQAAGSTRTGRTTVPELIIVPVDPHDDEAVGRRTDLHIAAEEADLPGDPPISRIVQAGMLRHPWPGTERLAWLAMANGEAVGALDFDLSTVDNLDTAPFGLEVHPQHRRRGIGRALLAAAIEKAVAGGRNRLVTEAALGGAGEAFARAVGARSVLVETERRLVLDDLDEPHIADLLADALAHSSGYSVLQWVGPTPDEHLAAMGELTSRMSTDAPLDDLAWEPEVFDADRLREADQRSELRGNISYVTAARNDSSGSVVGFTRLVVARDVRTVAWQWQTIVLPEHRGHRLGMLVKVANLDHLRTHEPAVSVIHTGNADSNAPMLRVNIALGFVPVRQWSEWELTAPG